LIVSIPSYPKGLQIVHAWNVEAIAAAGQKEFTDIRGGGGLH
jgi:hypothetical protein